MNNPEYTYGSPYSSGSAKRAVPEGATITAMGPLSYSEEAARELVQKMYPGVNIVTLPTMGEVWQAASRGDYIVVPTENSSSGAVWQHLETMLKHPELTIVAQVNHRVRMCVLGTEGSSLERAEKIVSHPQGLKQCSRFLDELEKQTGRTLERIPAVNTGDAAQRVANMQDVSALALAAPSAAKTLGLTVLANDVSNIARNITQMLVLHKNGDTLLPDVHQPLHAAHITLLDRPGALRDMLKTFADGGVDLLSLHNTPQSVPVPGVGNTVGFFVEMARKKSPQEFQRTLSTLQQVSSVYSTQWYGSWHNCLEPEKTPVGVTDIPPLNISTDGLDPHKKYHGFHFVPGNRLGILSQVVEVLSGPNGSSVEANLTSVHSITIGPKEYAFRLGMEGVDPSHVAGAVKKLIDEIGIQSLQVCSFHSPEELEAFLKR